MEDKKWECPECASLRNERRMVAQERARLKRAAQGKAGRREKKKNRKKNHWVEKGMKKKKKERWSLHLSEAAFAAQRGLGECGRQHRVPPAV